MRWLSRLQQLISGADFNTAARLKQSEYSRTTVRSVEITIETDEAILYQATDGSFPVAASAEHRQNANGQAPNAPVTVQRSTSEGESNAESQD
jgi:hypothetical protein